MPDGALTQRAFLTRLIAAGCFVVVCFGLVGARFVDLQVLHYAKYATEANNNRISIVPIAPSRGLITDRNGVVLARNYSAYTLELTPSKLQQPLPVVLDELAQLMPITAFDRKRFAQALVNSRQFESVPILLNLTDAEVARFVAREFAFPGVQVRARQFREYPLGTTAADVIGYIGRISEKDQAHIDAASAANDADADTDSDSNSDRFDPRLEASNYRGTDFIGKVGVEQSYETQLHGLSGFEQMEVTAGGHPVRVMSTTPAKPGDDVKLSIDIGLQEAAERAFAGHRGALVAIEPATGDILAFVSAPSFDPNLFVNGIDEQDWKTLSESPDKPLLDRPLRGTYAPGSTYKPFMALAALTLHARTRTWGFHDPGYFMFGGHKFRNDVHNGQGWVDMYKSIVVSNDTYYFMLAHDLGVDAIAKFMAPWGFGQKTGIDIDGEAIGVLPSKAWKEHTFKTPALQKWYAGETVSLGIGQGYNSFTILQLAHALATLANNGVVMRPHLVRDVRDPNTGLSYLTVSKPEGRIDVSQSDIDFVKSAMVGVATEGLAKKIFAGAPYTAAVKTGTAQVVGIGKNQHYNAKMMPENLRDNSLFEAFAPADHPQIALALVVENGGWGAEVAGPIARKMVDYYLVDRNAPGAEAAAVALAASATPAIVSPIIGGQPTDPVAKR